MSRVPDMPLRPSCATTPIKLESYAPGSEGKIELNVTQAQHAFLLQLAAAWNEKNPEHSAPWLTVTVKSPESKNAISPLPWSGLVYEDENTIIDANRNIVADFSKTGSPVRDRSNLLYALEALERIKT